MPIVFVSRRSIATPFRNRTSKTMWFMWSDGFFSAGGRAGRRPVLRPRADAMVGVAGHIGACPPGAIWTRSFLGAWWNRHSGRRRRRRSSDVRGEGKGKGKSIKTKCNDAMKGKSIKTKCNDAMHLKTFFYTLKTNIPHLVHVVCHLYREVYRRTNSFHGNMSIIV